MIENYKCCEQVYSGSPYFPYTCGKTAKVERDGKHYCGIHDPVRRAEKQREKREAWDAEYEAKKQKLAKEKAEADEQKRRAGCFPDLLEALKEARRIVADSLEAFGECDHSVGICNCDMKRSIEASDAAIKKATQ